MTIQTGPRSYQSAKLVIAIPRGLPDSMHDQVREVIALYVPEEDRNQGLATGLMDRTLMEADADSTTLFLRVKPESGDMERLTRFYARLGFVTIQDSPRLMVRSPKHSDLRLARTLN